MAIISYFFAFCTLYSISGNEIHEFHLSKGDIEYNAESNTLEISLSIFIDDLEEGLRGRGLDSLKICTKKEKEGVDEYLMSYIKDHLNIEVDGVRANSYHWLGKEISEDLAAVWCYIEVPIHQPKHSIYVYYDLLMDIFPDQKNVVKLNFNKSKKGFFLFSKGDSEGTLEL